MSQRVYLLCPIANYMKLSYKKHSALIVKLMNSHPNSTLGNHSDFKCVLMQQCYKLKHGLYAMYIDIYNNYVACILYFVVLDTLDSVGYEK